LVASGASIIPSMNARNGWKNKLQVSFKDGLVLLLSLLFLLLEECFFRVLGSTYEVLSRLAILTSMMSFDDGIGSAFKEATNGYVMGVVGCFLCFPIHQKKKLATIFQMYFYYYCYYLYLIGKKILL
jgi:hypothetical protein